jgi:hypothetical protein
VIRRRNCEISRGLGGDDRDLAVGLVVLNGAVLEGEERPIATDADILASVQLAAALTHDDGAGENGLTAESFDARRFE